MLRIFAIILLCFPFISQGEDIPRTVNLDELKQELRRADLPLPHISVLETIFRDRYAIITTEVVGNDLWLFRTLKKVSVHYTPDTDKRWRVTELEVVHTVNPVGWLLLLVFVGLAVVSGINGGDKIRAGASMTGIAFGIVLSVATLVLNRVLETQFFSTIAIVLFLFGVVIAIEHGARWITIAQGTGALVAGIIALYIDTGEFGQVFRNLIIFFGVAVAVEVLVLIGRTATRLHKILQGLQNNRLPS